MPSFMLLDRGLLLRKKMQKGIPALKKKKKKTRKEKYALLGVA